LYVSEQGSEEAPIPKPVTFQLRFKSTPIQVLPEGAVCLNNHCVNAYGNQNASLNEHCRKRSLQPLSVSETFPVLPRNFCLG
jgi:hypothetical protein